jgi:hypothetical protein
MKLPSLSFLLEAFLDTVRRFPLAMAAALTGTVAVLWLIEDVHETVPEQAALRLFMVALLGLPLLIAARAFVESRSELQADRPAPVWLAWALEGVIVLLLGVYYFTLDPDAPGFEYVGLPRYFALLIVAHLAVAVAPYLNERPVADFWEYNKQLFANLIVGGAYTFILFAGLALALLAVDQLFDLNIEEENYARLFVVLAGIFNTVFFLHRFPTTYRFDAGDESYNAVFRNLCQYILIPIVGLYFLILYAYSAKILVTWSLPKGWVSSLVIGFSMAGIFTYLLNYLLPRQNAGLPARTFSRWFWWVLLPMTVLLFAAIGRRLADYGVTEERYLVVATGLWLLGLCLYFILSRNDNIKFIPISLAAVVLLAFFGPFNAFQSARRSQLRELRSVLTAAGRWQNEVMRPGREVLTGEEAERARSILTWFTQRDRLDALAPHLPVSVDSLVGTTADKDYWGRADKLGDWLKLADPGRGPASEDRQVSISAIGEDRPGMEIRGFTEFYELDEAARNPGKFEHPGRYMTISADGLRLEWRDAGQQSDASLLLESFDLQPFLRTLRTRGALDEWGRALEREEARYDVRGRRADVRLVVRQGSVHVRGEQASFAFLNALVFVREK